MSRYLVAVTALLGLGQAQFQTFVTVSNIHKLFFHHCQHQKRIPVNSVVENMEETQLLTSNRNLASKQLP